MSNEIILVEGIIREDGTLKLEGKLGLPAGRVQVMVVQLPVADPFWQRMQVIWDGQKARGHVSRSVQDVEAERQALRDEWDERMRHFEGIRSGADMSSKARVTDA